METPHVVSYKELLYDGGCWERSRCRFGWAANGPPFAAATTTPDAGE